MLQISDNELTLADVSEPDADWGMISKFALTFNGYEAWGSFEKCAEIANTERHDSLAELRTCLFFEQRRWNHFGYKPDKGSMIYIRDLIEQIRSRVFSGELRHGGRPA